MQKKYSYQETQPQVKRKKFSFKYKTFLNEEAKTLKEHNNRPS